MHSLEHWLCSPAVFSPWPLGGRPKLCFNFLSFGCWNEKFPATPSPRHTSYIDSVIYFLRLEGLPRLFVIYILSVLYYRFPQGLTSHLRGCLFILHEKRDPRGALFCHECGMRAQVQTDKRSTRFTIHFISLCLSASVRAYFGLCFISNERTIWCQ
jgi:hypothetical protein